MYKDVIRYKLAEGISEEHLLHVASKVVKLWMSKQPGFMKWEIHKNNNGKYTDIVYWESKESAKKAEADMANIPNANDWFACYEEGSISTEKLSQVAAFNK